MWPRRSTSRRATRTAPRGAHSACSLPPQRYLAIDGRGDPNTPDPVRVVTLDQGLCVQTLHVGPFDEKGAVLARMRDEFIPAQRLAMTGRHHQICFSDARRVDAAKFRTILRQPVRPGQPVQKGRA